MKHQNLMHIAAKSNITILLQGESGSGKEVAAQFIHQHSPRQDGPFIALNCGAIAKNLTESILEGAKKGAYTGASDQMGMVRAANGGTLFLDEIGEMPLDTQCKLLRILQERSVLPLGQTHSVPVDFRLICATNRNLKAEVAAGRFREDLFFRLNVFPIRVPALRERDDIKELTQNLWEDILQELYPIENKIATDAGSKPFAELTTAELQLIESRRWPGNIRQLKNVLQRYALLKPHDITLHEIISDEYDCQGALMEPNAIPPQQCKATQTKRYATAPQWDIIANALHKYNWNKCVTARSLGISRGCLDYQIRKHGDQNPRDSKMT